MFLHVTAPVIILYEINVYFHNFHTGEKRKNKKRKLCEICLSGMKNYHTRKKKKKQERKVPSLRGKKKNLTFKHKKKQKTGRLTFIQEKKKY